MENYWNFKSVIVLNKAPLVKDPTVTKVSVVLKSNGTDPLKLVSLEIYTNNRTKGIEYLVLQMPIQTFGQMCLDTKMVGIYEHFVLCRGVLLSEYWREACADHKNWKEGNVWSNEVFAIIMREFKNRVLFGEHAVAAGYVFHSYLGRVLKKQDNMTLKSFRACFKVLFKV